MLFAVIFSAGCCGLEEFAGGGWNGSIDIDDGGGGPQRNTTGGLYGTVTDLDYAPLENVSVTLIGDAANYSDSTGADGKYNIGGVPEGQYALVIWKEGYQNKTFDEFAVLGGYSRSSQFILVSSTGGLYGTITDLKKVPLADATVSIIGNGQNYSQQTGKDGGYHISGISPGTYVILVQTAGRRNVTLADFTILEGRFYSWNATAARDCIYYAVNASTDYVIRYGFNTTVYRGDRTSVLAYPEEATYDIYPAEASGLSRISTSYLAGNRLLEWKLDNSDGDYSSVDGHFYININGTGAMQLYDRKEINISDAASRQPNYLKVQTNEDGKRMIDPSDREIVAIAQRVKDETGSNDTWTIARALFLWLKNNTVYHIYPGTDSHSAIETLHSGKGKCDELSQLYISLLRADNIPARFVKGYSVKRNPDQYVSHEWVEFYDGDWVPVEVASSGAPSAEADTRFGVRQPDHVETFTDDGTDDAINAKDTSTGKYYDLPATFEFSTYYDAVGHDPMYIAACADGTRELMKEKE